MTDQLTDEYLEKRAEEIAKTVLPADTFTLKEVFPNGWYSEGQSNRMNSYKFATLDALKVHRESLRQLELVICNEDCPSNYFIHPPDPKNPGEMYPCNCGRDQHIASLRELLGVSQ